jgi:hypothetical protein
MNDLNTLDQQSKDVMINAERKCRWIKSGWIPFSPESAIWIQRTQAYKSLLRHLHDLIRNVGNLKRTARRCSIQRCISIPEDKIILRLKVYEERCNYFQKHGQWHQKAYLKKYLQNAKDKDNEDKAKEILAIIEQEKSKSHWRRLNHAMGKRRGGAPWRVLVEDSKQEGAMVEYNTQETVQNAIWDNIHQLRFRLAEPVPICSDPLLREAFGYNLATNMADVILAETYVYPPNFDQATREICKECACIRLMIPKDSVSTHLSKEDWQYQ